MRHGKVRPCSDVTRIQSSYAECRILAVFRCIGYRLHMQHPCRAKRHTTDIAVRHLRIFLLQLLSCTDRSISALTLSSSDRAKDQRYKTRNSSISAREQAWGSTARLTSSFSPKINRPNYSSGRIVVDWLASHYRDLRPHTLCRASSAILLSKCRILASFHCFGR